MESTNADLGDMEFKIRAAIGRWPDYGDSKLAKNIKPRPTAGDVAAVRAQMNGDPLPKPSAPEATNGIRLSGKRVLSRRPTETAAKYIKRLPENKGFDPKELSLEWGMAEETVKKHARDMGCLKFVEVEEDEWKSLVLSPATAAKFK